MTDHPTPVPCGHVLLIHGDIASGKTRRAAHWAESQGLAGRVVGGVLATKTPGGRRFMDLIIGDEVPLEHPGEGEVAVAVGRFQFRQAAIDWAISRTRAAVAAGAQAVVIDEVGPLEMRGEGFADLLDGLEREHPAVQRVLLVRTDLIQAVADRFGAGSSIVFDPPL